MGIRCELHIISIIRHCWNKLFILPCKASILCTASDERTIRQFLSISQITGYRICNLRCRCFFHIHLISCRCTMISFITCFYSVNSNSPRFVDGCNVLLNTKNIRIRTFKFHFPCSTSPLCSESEWLITICFVCHWLNRKCTLLYFGNVYIHNLTGSISIILTCSIRSWQKFCNNVMSSNLRTFPNITCLTI